MFRRPRKICKAHETCRSAQQLFFHGATSPNVSGGSLLVLHFLGSAAALCRRWAALRRLQHEQRAKVRPCRNDGSERRSPIHLLEEDARLERIGAGPNLNGDRARGTAAGTLHSHCGRRWGPILACRSVAHEPRPCASAKLPLLIFVSVPNQGATSPPLSPRVPYRWSPPAVDLKSRVEIEAPCYSIRSRDELFIVA